MKVLASLKAVFFVAAIAIVLLSCKSGSYISGKLTGEKVKGCKIYLIQPSTLKELSASYFGKVVDSAVVMADGSFDFNNTPKLNKTTLFELALQQTSNYPNFLETENLGVSNYMLVAWQPGECLQITADSKEFQKSFLLKKGSAINKSLLALRDVSQKAYQTWLAGKHWVLEDGSQLLEKEHAVLEYQKALMNFADTTSYFLSAMAALRWVSPEDNYERVPEFLVNQCNKWKKQSLEHAWLDQLCQKSNTSNLPVLVGSAFPDLQFTMLSKDTMLLRDLLGKKLTIIDLWASWCAPCRKENRELLVPLWKEYHNKGLQIIAYGMESDELNWKEAIIKDGADWPQSSDLQGDDAPLLKQMRIQTIPANFILDEKGIVVAKNLHGVELISFVESRMEEK